MTRGLGDFPLEVRREISRKGGKAAYARHKWSKEEAKYYGALGGKRKAENRRKLKELADGEENQTVD